MELTVEIYNLVRFLPKEELYGLSDQMRRAAVSIPSNIAEGQGRESNKEFLYFLSVAYGSVCELNTHIEISNRLGYIDDDKCSKAFTLIDEVSKMINSLSNYLSKN